MDKELVAQSMMESFRDLEKTLHRSLFSKLSSKVSPSQMFVLMRLMKMNCKVKDSSASRPGMRVSDLANLLGISVPGMTQLISGLEKDGYVRREMDPQDRRAVLVYLTDGGRQLMQPAYRYLVDLFGGLVEILGAGDAQKFMELIERANLYFIEAGLV